jgi:NADPH:quinone reductase-like Zn-dependent oxidoreductase
VLRLRDIAAPAPGRGEVLVRVRAAGADPGVWHSMTELAQSGTLTPVIGRTYPLAGATGAIRDIAAGPASGKGVITV